ncbi:hypothetical protein [Marinimicrobium alkaliphilum]|uniref:hypothetical protein n=1 Tax=Marinimicrobium alkaliphilum TaxID=2202654 RepID=UPI000DB92A4C|nr:hypothetical protein [Marinimicrobium alkaliphilum]
MKTRTLTCTLLLLLAGAAQASDAIVYHCSLGDDERIVSVVYSEPGQALPCDVTYERGGEVETLWQARNQAGYCEEQAQNFVAQQVAWGWECGRHSPDEPQSDAPDVEGAEPEPEPAY